MISSLGEEGMGGGMWIFGEGGEYLQVRSSYRGTFLSRAGAGGAIEGE